MKSEDKTKSYLELSDVALVVLDGSRRLDGKDRRMLGLVRDKKKIVVINKSDLGNKISKKDLEGLAGGHGAIRISATRGTNIGRLEKKISALVWSGSYVQGESAVVANARHKELLDKSHECVISVVKALKRAAHPELIAVDLKEAIFTLGTITGASVSDDILDRIFGKFCIGK
jgi:tRNA modification GTPase